MEKKGRKMGYLRKKEGRKGKCEEKYDFEREREWGKLMTLENGLTQWSVETVAK